jgi:pimeloyl-ACP methyl ester carboxylesterase
VEQPELVVGDHGHVVERIRPMSARFGADELLTPPRLEGTVRVPGRRRLGVAEWGAPGRHAVVWLHGTPGARRQIPQEARLLAVERHVHLIGIDRPGVGLSTPHQYDSIVDFMPDLERVVDQLGIDRFAVVGLSGGGPYTLAAASYFGDRVPAVGILGGVVPSTGPHAVSGGLVGLAKTMAPVMPLVRRPMGAALTGLVRLVKPLGTQALELYAKVSPPGDREVLLRPEFRAMFLDDLTENGGRSMRALVPDGILFTKDWGFDPTSVTTPVHWWHGDADNIVPFSHAESFVPKLPNATLYVRPGQSHLGGLSLGRDIFDAVLDW